MLRRRAVPIFVMTLREWKPGLIAAAVLAVITSVPQIYLCYERGSEWNGSFASFDTDEFAYAAYVNALINQRPRLNDPYTGQDGGSFETLFSIQFFPAYAVAIPARMGVSASSAYIILLPLITIASALILFRLLFELTQNENLSAIGAFGVLCFGWSAATAPWIFFSPHVAFPFLRRYMPAFPFPFFLALTLFVWWAIVKNSFLWAFLTGLTLIVLIYSYFFLWTAAAAWLVVLLILWVVARPQDRQMIWRVFGVIGAMGLIALIPFAWLIQYRRPGIDQVQLMVELTHRPDLLRGPEIYGAVILLGLIGRDWRQPKTLFMLSFALAPFLVFNQQLITGRSVQPFHYEQFVANYWVLIGLFLAFGVRWSVPRRILVYLALAGLGLGLSYGLVAAMGRFKTNVAVDKGRAAALKLDGKGLVFASSRDMSYSLAATASNPVLWARYLLTFSHVGFEDQKRRSYQYLYYSKVGEDDLRTSLKIEGDSARFETFGVDRANPALTSNPRAITPQEIEQAVADYGRFSSTFGRADAVTPLLSYAIVSPTDDLSNLDKWYERDAGERVGAYNLYRLKLRE
ncbi:MAG: hypothetical protein QOG23_1842 [Blastocatellia bacterium]|nr:hypothetical protein [Blastocatellia bacterium]